jgi:hypothetical protein
MASHLPNNIPAINSLVVCNGVNSKFQYASNKVQLHITQSLRNVNNARLRQNAYKQETIETDETKHIGKVSVTPCDNSRQTNHLSKCKRMNYRTKRKNCHATIYVGKCLEANSNILCHKYIYVM